MDIVRFVASMLHLSLMIPPVGREGPIPDLAQCRDFRAYFSSGLPHAQGRVAERETAGDRG